MTSRRRTCLLPAVLLAALATGQAGAFQTHQSLDEPAKDANKPQLPNTPGKETVLKLCGNCHSANIVLGRGLTQEGWSEIVSSMIAKGAKGSDTEFSQVIDYLSKSFPPKTAPGGTLASARKGGGGGFTMGPDDKQVVDETAATRGRKLYITECVTCHGPLARGGAGDGADLVRSVLVLHDRYGSTLGPYLAKGHQTQSGTPSSSFTKQQVADLSHFLHKQVNDTLRSGPYSKVLNVLTGDPKAGQAYFSGEGKCSTCHSPTGDMAKIASKYDAPTLQQRMLFPKTIGYGRGGMMKAKPTTVTVTPPNGKPVTGVLERIDDFNVSLRDSSGVYYSYKRTPDLKLEKNDPYTAHNELLDQYTDKDIHNLVAYLETLK